ncbi:hypothetical protein [Paenibacillus sp. FSL W8-0919]|jgi:hypothetical protein|uniref:hypothetical protein n=1 Tax=unclassified Paenibacillus TaxID=185978 RepID=UPI0030FC5257
MRSKRYFVNVFGKIFAMLLLVMALGCSGTSKQDVLDFLSSDSKDQYKIHLFYETYSGLDMQLLEFMNSSDVLLKVIQGIQVYDLETPTNRDIADKIGLNRFPAIMVTNDKEVVLKTQELEDIRSFFNDIVQ